MCQICILVSPVFVHLSGAIVKMSILITRAIKLVIHFHIIQYSENSDNILTTEPLFSVKARMNH